MKPNVKTMESALHGLLTETDPGKHRKAILRLLEHVGLEDVFVAILEEEEDAVERFFLSMDDAVPLIEDATERKHLRKIGALSRKWYTKKEYVKLCDLYSSILFFNVADFLHLEERDDFETMTDQDLFIQGLLPEEIFFQYFLLEVCTKDPRFDWNRDKEVIRQCLAFFIVCFGDVYEFFGAEDEDETGLDDAAVTRLHPPKVGRNDPCHCGSGKKYKKCHEDADVRDKPRCGLCGQGGNLVRTDCCDTWICNDKHEYVAFSYARNSCSRNHRRMTLCGHHHTEGHQGPWQECDGCRADFSHMLEMYVWYGTNEYNFTKLENPPPFTPTYCGKCGKRIVLPEEDYSSLCGEYRCERCPITDSERDSIIAAYEKGK